jgi:hypothetical protein
VVSTTGFFMPKRKNMEDYHMMQKAFSHLAKIICPLALALALLPTAAFAADTTQAAALAACYPTAVTRSEDGAEIRKMYDLGPTEDPTGIPRSDFEQDGCHYTLTDLLKQELPENESRQHTETVSVPSKSKDMASVLALLPETKEFITDDGLSGTLKLKLDTVNAEVAGYGSSTKALTATRTYPGLASQDTQYIPKSIEDNKNTLTLQSVSWQTDGVSSEDGSERYTAVATYSGSASSSYVTGYTVTADYTGTVSRINLNKTRYVAIFEGEPIETETTEDVSADTVPDSQADEDAAQQEGQTGGKNLLLPVGVVAAAGAGVGAALYIKRRKGR